MVKPFLCSFLNAAGFSPGESQIDKKRQFLILVKQPHKMQQKLTANKRIESIDIIRGIAMVIMALDHTRDYFHITANIDDPLNLATTTPFLYLTRWITNLCTPTFVFLAGTSAWLQSRRKTTKALSKFSITRKQLFAAGSVYISTDQPLGDLAIVSLEPTSKDSYFNWVFFLSIFQHRIYGSIYNRANG